MTRRRPGFILNPALHQRHRLKVAAGLIRRAAGMYNSQMPLLPGLDKRRHGRVQAEKAVQVDRPPLAASPVVIRPGYTQRRTGLIIGTLAVRHNHIHSIRSPT